MTDESANPGGPAAGVTSAPGLPAAVDRATFAAEVDRLRVREKAHTREGDAIAAARRCLPMAGVDASLALIGPHGPLSLADAFEGRRQLIAYYFMGWPGRPAAGQCEGCTWVTTQVGELSYLHSRDVTCAVLCQGPTPRAPATASSWAGTCRGTRPRTPRRAARRAPKRLVPPGVLPAGRRPRLGHLLDDPPRAEAMDYSYALMDLTVYGRQEPWEDSPPGWPQRCSITRTDAGPPAWPPVSVRPGGRPIAQWPRLEAGRSDDLGTGHDGR
jgi:hypothetical protein